jgi:hypothetical protein
LMDFGTLGQLRLRDRALVWRTANLDTVVAMTTPRMWQNLVVWQMSGKVFVTRNDTTLFAQDAPSKAYITRIEIGDERVALDFDNLIAWIRGENPNVNRGWDIWWGVDFDTCSLLRCRSKGLWQWDFPYGMNSPTVQ